DDRTYRTREEVEAAKRSDSLILFGRYIMERGLLDTSDIEKLRTEIKQQVDVEVEAAWKAADPEPESALRHVFAENGSGFRPIDWSNLRQEDSGDAGQKMEQAEEEILDTTGGEATPSEPPAGGEAQP
ncbi:MAG TPA: thiamine pyrophosphate-dependent enzyme, partial [Actinomycetota bacterium]|nr:thiamine pyrophosphate-dependent enzyme [Actinomycetota bacterium]